jgi:Lon protease-like protein
VSVKQAEPVIFCGTVAPDTEILPIFPLSNVVLFPRVTTPLHLFEPRYRQMAEHVLAGNRRIGMVTVPPEHAGAMPGDPPVHSIGCAGTVIQAGKRPDGCYDIVLLGTERFRILGERARPETRLYRVAEVAPLEDPYDPADVDRVAELRTRIVELLAELIRRSTPRPPTRVSPALFRELDDVSFVNLLANAIPLTPPEKQGLLEADGILQRFEHLEGLLSFHRAGLRTPGGRPSGALH